MRRWGGIKVSQGKSTKTSGTTESFDCTRKTKKTQVKFAEK
jgi:hypothetical protein